MTLTGKQQFAARLVTAMRERGYISKRGAASGVDVGPLAKTAAVTREMARRYTDGSALPDPNKMPRLADWLEVRVAWLRDGEGAIRAGEVPSLSLNEPGAALYLSAEAMEIARVWLKLPPERRNCFRDLMCLEAVVATHYPWLMFGRPHGESYNEYERRVERDILRIAERLTKAAP